MCDKRDEARIAAAKRLLGTDYNLNRRLSQQPHPSISGSSLLNYVAWMLENAGRSGRLMAALIVEENCEQST